MELPKDDEQQELVLNVMVVPTAVGPGEVPRMALIICIALNWLCAWHMHSHSSLSVQVTILDQGTVAEEVSRGQAMAALLEQLELEHTFRPGRPREVATRTSPRMPTPGRG